MQGGLLADGCNSLLAALMTTAPNTTFSQNNGVIALTRCASRAAGLSCAVFLFLFGVIGKFGGVVASIPDCVLGGMTTFLFANVIVSGITVLSKVPMTRRNRFILALSLGPRGSHRARTFGAGARWSPPGIPFRLASVAAAVGPCTPFTLRMDRPPPFFSPPASPHPASRQPKTNP